MSSEIVVAVVSHNLRELLEPCLRSLAPEAEAGGVEVWVVDNASTDGSPEMVRERFPWVKLVASPENLGFPQAVNHVADRTDSAWLVPANEDTELLSGALEELVASARRHPRAGIVAPRLIQRDGSQQHSVHPFPTVGFSALFNLGLHRLSRRLAERFCLEGWWDAERGREVPWALAAFVLVRREAFEAIGGFDRRMWMYADDIDLAWRMAEAGWSTRYEPRARVRHVGGAATDKEFGDELSKREAWMAATYAWMVRRRGLAATWAVAVINTAGALARFALLTPAAAVAPGRYEAARQANRHWARMHRAGLRPRRELLRHS